MTNTHSAADLRAISLANVARWDGGPSKTSHLVSLCLIEICLSIASRAARGLGTPAENSNVQHVFGGFLRVFLRACPRRRKLAPLRSRKVLVLNYAQSQTDALRS